MPHCLTAVFILGKPSRKLRDTAGNHKFLSFLLLVCHESRHAVVAELRHAALLKGYSAHKSRVQALQNEVDQAHLTASLFRARPVKPKKEKPKKKTAGG
jgi:hypothetical protein